MNAEQLRQHHEHKGRQERIGRAPACRAIQQPIVREKRQMPRGEFRRSAPPPSAAEAIEREHMIRVRCIREAYEAERIRRRAIFAAEMEEVRKRELADIAASAEYRTELLREVTA